jgi:hypothetical protein
LLNPPLIMHMILWANLWIFYSSQDPTSSFY